VLLGRFHVEQVLGWGGMGEVLLARDRLLDRRVALKRFRGDFSRDHARAMLQEARRASRVNDRRVASVHDVVTDGDDVLIVMEYVEGETLRSRLREPMRLDEFWDVARQCLAGLAAAHAQGVIHRDIKPENLMLTHEGEVKILDFGIARRSGGGERGGTSSGLTSTGELYPGPAGTPPYMAPEAHYGGRIDERTDIFSLGAVFYEMLTAQRPFTGQSYEQVVERIINTPPRPASELNPVVSERLSDVIARMLARDPARRFASCHEVRAALEAARRGTGDAFTKAATEHIPIPSSVWHAGRRRWVALAVALAVSAAGVVLLRVLAPPRLPAERQLAVLLPLTPGASSEFSAYALGATELLAGRLMKHQDRPGFQMSSFQDSFDEKLGSAGDARKSYGANLALRPTVEQRENRLHATLELLEPGRGRSLGRRIVDVPAAEPFAFADSLYHAALALLRLPVRPQTAQADLGIRGAGTLRFLMQGLGRRRSADSDEGRARAIADLETACRTEPDPAVPHAWLAWALLTQYAAGHDSTWAIQAEASAREALGLDSSRADVHRILAFVLVNRQRLPEALSEYRAASRLDPTDDDGWYRWGRTAQRVEGVDAERRIYEAAITRRPHCFKPRWWLATWQYRNGHLNEAEQGYREMIRRSPAYFNGYANLGGLLLFKGEFARAIDTLRLAVDLNPNSTAFNNLGTAYFNSGRLAQAVDAYNQAFQFGDADYQTWLNLGDAYFWLRNRPDQAREAYRQAVRLGHEEMAKRARGGHAPDAMIPALLGTAFPKLGERDSARAMMRQALAIDSLNSRVQYQAALTEWQLGSYDSALGWLGRAVANGYPIAWLRDSPVHRDWRRDPGFQALLASAAPANTGSPGKGGGR